MAKKDDNGNWLDPRGQSVPPKFVPDVDKKRDQTVEKVHTIIDKLEVHMKDAKSDILELIADYLEWLTEKTKTTREGKGNLTLTSFSGDKQLEIRINDVIDFDERLSLAKTKVDECIKNWSGEANSKIVTIVRQAFNLDKSGAINKAMIMRLLSLEIKDNLWREAMELITQSIHVKGAKQYLQIKRLVKTESGAEKWEPANLNFSAM